MTILQFPFYGTLRPLLCIRRQLSGKQLVIIGEGNSSALFVLGMLLGAAVAHNFGFAAAPTGVPTFTPYVLIAGLQFVYISH